MPDCSRNSLLARIWETMPTLSRADTAYGASFTMDQVMSDSPTKT